MDLVIPNKFSSLLNGVTDEVSGAVGAAFHKVIPILLRNESPFFPDYTDHGIQHIESVLQTCETLISYEAWNVFTREDSAALILAIISHDLGMLIDVDGFNYLISDGNEISCQLEKKILLGQNYGENFNSIQGVLVELLYCNYLPLLNQFH